jgi:hypothetical protein
MPAERLEVINGAVMMRRSASDANAVPGVWRNEESDATKDGYGHSKLEMDEVFAWVKLKRNELGS